MSKNLRALSARRKRGITLYQALAGAAEEPGGLTQERLRSLAGEWRISRAALLGTASFYDLLGSDRSGIRACVCKGTSCRLSGKHAEALAALSDRHDDHEIEQVECMGNCFSENSFRDDEEGGETIPYFCVSAPSLFTDPVVTLKEFYDVVVKKPAEIMKEISASRLRGRGGAGFVFADKVAVSAEAPEDQKFVVCNGDEGDPGSFSDRYLMEAHPHRVLAGMLAVGQAIGADTGYVYLRAEYPAARPILSEAIAAFEKTAAFARTGFRIHLVVGAGSYVCGEETALLNSIEGLRPEVRIRPPYPAAEGLYGKPTLLSNVETISALPWILSHGGEAFRKIGTADSTGTKLLSLDYSFNNPGVHEVPMGTPLRNVIDDLGGGFRNPVKAIQVGGPLGSVVPVERLDDLAVEFESFAREGFLLGHAGLVGIPRDFPMIDFLCHLFSYMAEESCGKCLPCRLGTEKGSRLLRQASEGERIDAVLLEALLETMELGSLCALGGGLRLPVRNVLDYFSAELAEVLSS